MQVCNLLLEGSLQMVLGSALLMRGKRIAQKLGRSSGKMKVTEVVNPASPHLRLKWSQILTDCGTIQTHWVQGSREQWPEA